MNSVSTTPSGGADDGADARASIVIWALRASGCWCFCCGPLLPWVDEIVRAEGSMISSSRHRLSRTSKVAFLAELAWARAITWKQGDVFGTVARHAVPVLGWMICAIRSAPLKSARLRLRQSWPGQYDLTCPTPIARGTPDIVASGAHGCCRRGKSDFVSRSEGAGRVLTRPRRAWSCLKDISRKDRIN